MKQILRFLELKFINTGNDIFYCNDLDLFLVFDIEDGIQPFSPNAMNLLVEHLFPLQFKEEPELRILFVFGENGVPAKFQLVKRKIDFTIRMVINEKTKEQDFWDIFYTPTNKSYSLINNNVLEEI